MIKIMVVITPKFQNVENVQPISVAMYRIFLPGADKTGITFHRNIESPHLVEIVRNHGIP